MKITGKYSQKRYRCCYCGHERLVGTNHYGEIYDRCPGCGWRRPPLYHPHRHECLEELPEGWGRPAPWKLAKLGDLVEEVTS